MDIRLIILSSQPLNWGDASEKMTRLLNYELSPRAQRIIGSSAKKSPSVC